MIPEGIERGHVERALKRIDAEGTPGPRQAKDWAVEHNGRHYSAKYVVGVAAELATGRSLLPSEFNSGGPNGARALLAKLGFAIVRLSEDAVVDRDDLDAAGARQLLQRWITAPETRRVCAEMFANGIEFAHAQGAARWSCAYGNRTRFGLNSGRSPAFRVWKNGTIELGLDGALVGKEADQALASASVKSAWDLRSLAGCVGYRFDAKHLAELRPLVEPAWKRFIERSGAAVRQCPYSRSHADAIVQAIEAEVGRDLPRPEYAFTSADEFSEIEPDTESDASSSNAPLSLAQLHDAIARTDLRIDARTLRRYHVALEVRKFVILAGISGTGKTWLTRAYANAVGAEYLLVPVAPNWTSNEDLLGFFNPLAPSGGLYVDSPASRFLRRAAQEHRSSLEAGRAAKQFHLVLDEMNLARVEHYFAKILSALEVRQRDETAPLELHANDVIDLTPNVYVVGTVNVDETTHGFSDKVYDRAQLIELPAPRDLIEAHVKNFVAEHAIMQLWDAVSEVAPFAFRVLDDITAYVTKTTELGHPWQEALDEQVLQKVLPKLKGSDPRVGLALDRIAALCETDFPLSHERARKMLDGFRQHGLASYF